MKKKFSAVTALTLTLAMVLTACSGGGGGETTAAAGVGMKEAGIHLSTDMFFESVPDEFVDIKLDKSSTVTNDGKRPSLHMALV